MAALKLALASPWNIWVYSKVADPAVLAAALFVDMASVNPFAGGNRRTAFLCAAAFIEAQGCSLTMPDSEVNAEKLRDFAVSAGAARTHSPNGCGIGSVRPDHG
jgi:prophage maintenance system killer protein